MRTLEEIDTAIERAAGAQDIMAGALDLMWAAEEVLEHWLLATGRMPTEDTWEGFRLLALHRRSAKGDPSFNACRETCREIAYRFNVIAADPGHAEARARLMMLGMVVRHLYLFVTGKMETEELGEFCCSSRPLRTNMD